MKTGEASVLQVMLFASQQDWDDWLSSHSGASPGLWLRLAKQSAASRSVSYQQALDIALCHGWIDGQKKSFDNESWLQKFTPRGPNSVCSKINRAKALALIEQGRMRPAGLAAVERAKQNGRWDAAYDSHRTAESPSDFLGALDQSPEAKAFFATLDRQNRYAVLYRIQTAKNSETRQKHIAQFISMLERHEKLHP